MRCKISEKILQLGLDNRLKKDRLSSMKTINLCLHSGGTEVSRNDLRHLQTPSPTKSWVPIPHFQLIDMVYDQLGKQGFSIVNDRHAIARGGSRYFGVAELRNGHNNDEFALAVGLRNSVDKSLPAGILLGTGVFVCDNLAFSSEFRADRRHTPNIQRDLPEIVQTAVKSMSLAWSREGDRVKTYKDRELTDQEASELIFKAFDAGACLQTQATDIWQQWKKPDFKEFTESKPNVWRLFNAFTTVYRGDNIFDLSERSRSLHTILDSTAGFVQQVQNN